MSLILFNSKLADLRSARVKTLPQFNLCLINSNASLSSRCSFILNLKLITVLFWITIAKFPSPHPSSSDLSDHILISPTLNRLFITLDYLCLRIFENRVKTLIFANTAMQFTFYFPLVKFFQFKPTFYL
jgi:hypothetical protein